MANLNIFKNQFFDANGVPLSGGKVYTYSAGTTTPKSTYTDSTGVTPNTNPVILNSRGEASIWLSGNYKIILKDSLDNQIWSVDNVAQLNDASNITFTPSGTGAVATTVQGKLRESVSVKDFGAVGDGVADDTAAIQNWVNFCSSNSIFGAQIGYAPAGKYKITATISFPFTYCHIYGDGMFQTQFMCDGVTGSVFKPVSMLYFKPCWSDFSIVDGTLTTTGVGIDFSAITSVVYDGTLERIYIVTKGHGIYAEKFFSMKIDTVLSSSSTGHSFLVSCGPGVTWINCYAISCGTGKAGYRLAGLINLIGCNGLNSGDYWGIFGQDPASGDGWQADFTTFTNDYPDINMIGCNVEYFTKCGIRTQGTYRRFVINGGKIDRAALSTAYESLISLGGGSNYAYNPIRLGCAFVTAGSGVPNGGAALTNAYIYARAGQPVVIDEVGSFVLIISGFYSAVYAALVPFVTQGAVNDIYGDSATRFNAIAPRRISANVIRYVTSTLTPVGAGQAIDVTGLTKVIVTPAASASITTATFTQTIGAGLDYLRNGDLIIEAGNANLTINHSASGANTFRMAGAANLTLAAGQVIRLCWSVTSIQWIQV